MKKMITGLIIVSFSTIANAQLGAAMGAGVDQYNRQQILDQRQQQIELDKQRMELDRQHYEMEKLRRIQMEDDRRAYEARIKAQSDNSDAVLSYVKSMISIHGENAKNAFRSIIDDGQKQLTSIPINSLKFDFERRIAKIEQQEAKDSLEMREFFDRYPDYKKGVKNAKLLEEAKLIGVEAIDGKLEKPESISIHLEIARKRVEKQLAIEKSKQNKSNSNQKKVQI